MADTSHLKAIDLLTPIWQWVLQRSQVPPDGNFFDLGGDFRKAVQLFQEINKVSGLNLPVLLICQAPTIATLVPFLEGRNLPAVPPSFLLRDGPFQPPVFITHGLGSSVLEFVQLARHIEFQHPFYGLQAKGTDGLEEPLDRIEAMAQFHIAEIRRIQPHGPYFLLGYSLGGLVAYEIARQLVTQGETIALLASIEGYPYLRFVSLGQQLQVRARVAKYHAQAMWHMPIPKAFSYLLHPAERQLYESLQRGRQDGFQMPELSAIAPGMPRVREAGYLALQRYRPGKYPGALQFVIAESRLHFPDNPRVFWAPLVGAYEEETVRGDHFGVLAVHFVDLAKALSRYLRAAEAIL